MLKGVEMPDSLKKPFVEPTIELIYALVPSQRDAEVADQSKFPQLVGTANQNEVRKSA
jgi:hypothetical protein